MITLTNEEWIEIYYALCEKIHLMNALKQSDRGPRGMTAGEWRMALERLRDKIGTDGQTAALEGVAPDLATIDAAITRRTLGMVAALRASARPPEVNL